MPIKDLTGVLLKFEVFIFNAVFLFNSICLPKWLADCGGVYMFWVFFFKFQY